MNVARGIATFVTVQKLMGHTNLETTRQHLNPDETDIPITHSECGLCARAHAISEPHASRKTRGLRPRILRAKPETYHAMPPSSEAGFVRS